jgi:hypothetical protein
VVAVCVVAAILAAHAEAGLATGKGSVVINEVLASNSRFLADPQGQFDDWIELYNRGDASINVAGMYLTDDPAVPAKWQFPAANAALTTIPAQGYLIVWADADAAPGLHASFKLSSEGETVALYDRDGTTLVDSVTFGTQTSDISYGRFPDGSDTWTPLTIPSPGVLNFSIYQGFVDQPRLSPERGFYNEQILVTVSCATPGATIYYTTDGSEPYSASTMRPGTTAAVYSSPIVVDGTTCLRAIAIKANWGASPIATSTYLFVADVITQSPQGLGPGTGWPSGYVNGQTIDYGMDPDVVNDPRYKDLMDDALLAIPSLSLVTDVANLFDSKKGIYVNPSAQGMGWERPVSVELMYPDGTEGFQANAGLRIRGGYSRSGSNPKHAFRLFFRAEYGAPTLKYPLFDDEGAGEFEGVDIRTSQNYSWSYEGGNSNSHDTFVREVFSRDTQHAMGQPYTRSRYYHLYINGQYWGLFQTQERAEASYAATYFGGNKEDYDVIKSRAGNGGYDIEATDGTLDSWRLLWNAAQSGFGDNATYCRVQGLNPDRTPNPAYPRLLDVDNLIDYMICTYYVGDPDGPVSAWGRVANNFYTIYNRVSPDGFKFFRHDAEHSLDNVQEARLFASTTMAVGASFNQSNPMWMHTHLVLHPDYKMRFADRVYKYFFNGGLLTPETAANRFMARADQIETAIIAESARWGDSKRAKPRNRDDDWTPDMQRMVNDYFPKRTGVVLNQFKSQDWYPKIDPPTFSQQGGHVAPGDSISLQGGAGALWYTLDGNDPRLPGSIPQTSDELKFVPENAAKRVLVPTGPVADAWKGGAEFDDSAWLGGVGGVGFERSTGYETIFRTDVQSQMYARNASCYLRIPFDVAAADLTGLTSLTLNVRYDDGFVIYLNGAEIARKNFTGNPTWNSAAFTQNPDDSAVAFEPFDVTAHLDKLRQGQNVLAVHAMNQSSTSSDFLISVELVSAKNPAGESPTGVSPSAIRYTGPITLSQSTQIKVRSLSNGVWSALNEAVFSVGPVAQSLRISEIMYHPSSEISDLKSQISEAEFIELTNVGSESIDLNLVRFAKGIDFTFPSFELAPGAYCLVIKDLAAFEAIYGNGLPIVGQYSGSLDNAGERIELLDAAGSVIESFEYEDGWFDLTDGLGFSLTRRDPAASNPANKNSWRASAYAGGSPGTDDAGLVPEPGSVVIDEVMANPAAGECDWIELHNSTDRAIDLGGWFLSDDGNDLTKYRIAEATSIPAGGYLVFTQDQHFGNAADPGRTAPFGLSKEGETVYLHSDRADAAAAWAKAHPTQILGGYSDKVKFDACEKEISSGRVQKSTGASDFVALTEPTPGKANAAPIMGPIVITEIMYHPTDTEEAEYVELLNIGSESVALYDADKAAPWRFTDDPQDPAIEMLFPSEPSVILTPGQYLVLAKDLSFFTSRYTLPAGVQVLAWGAGRLTNGGEKVQLSRPFEVDAEGKIEWIRVDRVSYSDGSHPLDFAAGVDPWPLEADGQGKSLARTDPHAYGNDPGNWRAAAPSPGRANP